MSTTYTGDGANVSSAAAPVITIPQDGDSRNAASVNTGMDALADYIDRIEQNRIMAALCGQYSVPTGSTVAMYGWAAFSDAGNNEMMIAVGAQSSAHGVVYYSPDGVTWTTTGGSTPAHDLRAVASNGTMLVAVGDGGTILTSSRGYSWTAQTSGTTVALGSIQWVSWANGGSGYWLATATGAAANITTAGSVLTSPDGVTWTARTTTAGSGIPQSIADNGTGKVIICCLGATGVSLLSSTDLVTWTHANVTSGFAAASNDVGFSYSNGLWCFSCNPSAANNQYVATSPDGVTWTQRAVTGLQATAGSGIVAQWGNSRYHAIVLLEPDGAANVILPVLAISFDGGVTWRVHNFPGSAAGYQPHNGSMVAGQDWSTGRFGGQVWVTGAVAAFSVSRVLPIG